MQEIGATGLLEGTGGGGGGGTVDSVVAGAGISVDNTDPANPIVTNIATGGSPAGADTEIQYNDSGAFGASSDLVFDNTAKTFKVMSSANNLLLVDAATGDYGLGDLDGIGNSTRLFIDDTGSVASIAAGGDRIRLNIDGTAFTAKIGDVDSIGNDTVLTVDDANKIINLSAIDPGNLNSRIFVSDAGVGFQIQATGSDVIELNATGFSATLSASDGATGNAGQIRAGLGTTLVTAVDGSTLAAGSFSSSTSQAVVSFSDSSFIVNGVIVNATNLRIGNYDASGNSTLITVNDTQQRITVNNRFETDKGADIAAANNLTLGGDGNLFVITGNTQINAITTANRQAGSMITLIFTGTPTVKHNTAGGAGTAVMFLAGSVDLTAANNTVLCLIYDGTQWQETSRKVA